MHDPDFSRRKWLAAGPAAVLFAASSAQAQPAADHSLGAKIYNIRDFGAKGDGATLDTAAVQAAIDACHRDQGGASWIRATSC